MSSIKMYYLTALLLLAVLALVGYAYLRSFTTAQEVSASLIDLSGTQRTRSQQIALKALLLINETDADQRAVLREEMITLIDEMRQTHSYLSTGTQTGQVSFTLSLEIDALYFDDVPSLDGLVRDYVSRARVFAQAPADELTFESANFLAMQAIAPQVLDALDRVVAQYNLEDQTRLMQLERSEAIFLFITLGGLVFVGVFVFYPMDRRIQTEQHKLLTEIDQRREVEQTLLRGEALYRRLAENLPRTAVLLFDNDLRYLLAEGEILEEAGYNKGKMIGRTVPEVLPPPALEKLLPMYQSALRGVAWDFEYTSALSKTYHIHSVPVKDDRGYIAGGMLTIYDITEQKHAERKLDENQLFIQRILKSTPDLIYIFDVDEERNIFASRILGDMLGYTPEAFYAAGGSQLMNLVHPDDRARFIEQNEILAQQLEGEDPVDIEMRLLHADGSWRWFNTRSLIFARHPDGRISQVIGLTQDIDQRKRTEEMLREREHLIEQITATLPDIIYIYDLSLWANVYANRPFGEAIGYDAVTIQELGRDFMSNTMHPEDWARFPGHFVDLSEAPQGTVLEFEYRMKTPQGDWIWLNSRDIVFKRDAEGHVLEILGVARNITERKNAEQARQESEERFRQIAESVSSAFWIVSPDNRETFYVSPAYESIWKQSGMEMYKNPLAFTESIDLEDLERVLDAQSKSLATGHYDIEYRIVRPDGAVRWIHSRAYPIITQDGIIQRIVSVSDDVTERKAYEKQAFNIAVEREHIRLLADFVHDTSHDLRTPLTIITTGLYLLRRITDPQKQAERIDLIEKQVLHLNQIIGDLHAMSDLDIATHLENMSLDVNQMLCDLATHYQRASREKNQTLVMNLETDLARIQADPERIKHAVMNIIDNAILYTGEGGTITVETSSTPAHVIVSVADTGIGIASEHITRIFDRFYKVNFARTSGQGGPGLGLSIVKKIAEMHQGRVEVQSTPDQGSIFRLYLPKTTLYDPKTEVPV